MKYNLLLASYPLLQVLFFVAALFFVESSLIISIGLILLSSIFMCFSLHISYHNHAHHKLKNQYLNRFIDLVCTALIGFPFHMYQAQHFMHHKFDNGIKDPTSTVKMKNGKLVPKHWFNYSFLWFSMAKKIRNSSKSFEREGFYNDKIKRKIQVEFLVNLSMIILLISISWKFLILCFTMIYFGWVFISMLNYGQHLPDLENKKIAYSYYPKWYNYLLFNNGLHAEHHADPATRYEQLKANENEGGINNHPHLLEPLFYTKTSSD